MLCSSYSERMYWNFRIYVLQSVSPLMHWEGILDVINSSPLFWVSICSHQLCADLVWVFLSGSIQILIFWIRFSTIILQQWEPSVGFLLEPLQEGALPDTHWPPAGAEGLNTKLQSLCEMHIKHAWKKKFSHRTMFKRCIQNLSVSEEHGRSCVLCYAKDV